MNRGGRKEDRRPLASRAVSNRELVKDGFRRAAITSAEKAESKKIAMSLMQGGEMAYNARDAWESRN